MSIAAANNLQVSITNRQILQIALPISFALFVPQINFITNNIFLGQLGEQEIGVGLNNGLQALISRRAGENRVEEIGRLFSQGVRIALVIAVTGILLTYFVAPVILKNAIKSPERYQQWIGFLRIRIWGLPFLYIYQMRNALLVGTNQSKYLVAGTLAEALGNVFFDYALIFGRFGLPQLGFNGAAYASIIAEFLGMFVIFLVIRAKGIDKRFSLFQRTKWDSP